MTLRVILTGLLLVGTAQASVQGIICMVDERPHDGQKQELIIQKNTSDKYDISYVVTGSQSWGAPETTQTTKLMKNAECEYDQKELVGDCYSSANKESQKYLNVSSRISRSYDSGNKKVVQSPLMLDFRFDHFVTGKPVQTTNNYFERKNCSLIQK